MKWTTQRGVPSGVCQAADLCDLCQAGKLTQKDAENTSEARKISWETPPSIAFWKHVSAFFGGVLYCHIYFMVVNGEFMAVLNVLSGKLWRIYHVFLNVYSIITWERMDLHKLWPWFRMGLSSWQKNHGHKAGVCLKPERIPKPIGSMYAIYGNIYHQYTPNVSIYTSTMDPMGNYGHHQFLPLAKMARRSWRLEMARPFRGGCRGQAKKTGGLWGNDGT
jgi:hypothetical protein